MFNERFTAIAAQLGDNKAAVQLAGVHAMAGLADDWATNRQTCIDVLCAYLRMPYEPDPGPEADTPRFREVGPERGAGLAASPFLRAALPNRTCGLAPHPALRRSRHPWAAAACGHGEGMTVPR